MLSTLARTLAHTNQHTHTPHTPCPSVVPERTLHVDRPMDMHADRHICMHTCVRAVHACFSVYQYRQSNTQTRSSLLSGLTHACAEHACFSEHVHASFTHACIYCKSAKTRDRESTRTIRVSSCLHGSFRAWVQGVAEGSFAHGERKNVSLAVAHTCGCIQLYHDYAQPPTQTKQYLFKKTAVREIMKLAAHASAPKTSPLSLTHTSILNKLNYTQTFSWHHHDMLVHRRMTRATQTLTHTPTRTSCTHTHTHMHTVFLSRDLFLSFSLFLPVHLMFSLSLSLTHTHTQKHTHTRKHTHAHTHTHTHTNIHVHA